jgi:hypothetical protein
MKTVVDAMVGPFWSPRPLRELWRQELRENQRCPAKIIIPRGWVILPPPPHHAVLLGLDINAWNELGPVFSVKRRTKNAQRHRQLSSRY